MPEPTFNSFAENEKLEAMSPQDRELRRLDILAEFKSKIEATEQHYQDEQKPQAAAATKKKNSDAKSTETVVSKLAETGKTA